MIAKIQYRDGSAEWIEATRILKEEGKLNLFRDEQKVTTWYLEEMREDIEEVTINGETVYYPVQQSLMEED